MSPESFIAAIMDPASSKGMPPARTAINAVYKQDARLRSIPVVVLTTSSDERDIKRCYDMGASTYIQKPVSFPGLAQAIRTMKDYWFGIAILPRQAV